MRTRAVSAFVLFSAVSAFAAKPVLRLATAEQVFVTAWREGEAVPVATPAAAGDYPVDVPCRAGTVLIVESKAAIEFATLDGLCATPVEVHLTARSTLSGRLVAPRGVVLPKWGSFHAAECGAARSVVDGPFPIESSRFRVVLPSECEEATLHIGTFAPVRVVPSGPAGAERDVGDVALRQGGMASMRVISRRDGHPVAGVKVTAVRAHELESMDGDWNVERSTIAVAVTSETGGVQLGGLPREDIVFVLHAPGRRHPQVTERYAFKAGTATDLGEVVLDRPSDVFVTTSLSGGSERAIELHTVELTPAGNTPWPRNVPIRGELRADGAVIADVPPGRWAVHVIGRLKNGFAIRSRETSVEVTGGLDTHVLVPIDGTVFRGHVTRDGVPVEGVLNLKTADRRAGQRSAVAAVNADGKFEVWLERGGDYSASIQDRRSGAGMTLGRYVAFEDSDEEVAIDLPSVRLRGRVREGAAAPSSNVMVTATQLLADPAGYVFARADSDGRFVLEGLSPGTWEAIAESSGATSEPVTVSVGASDVDNIELDVEPVRKTKIRIVDTTGVPIRDAFITVEVPRADAMSPRPQIRTTNAYGVAEFSLSAAQQETPVNIVVATLDVHLSCDVRRLEADQTIPIDPAAGVVRLTGRDWASMGGVQPWLVSSRGCAVPLLGTRLERESTGESAIVFPRLAAGSWTYVETHTPAEVAAVLTGKASALRAITRFEVAPGAISRVRLLSQ